MNQTTKISSLIATALVLGACGGSGSNDMSSNNAEIKAEHEKHIGSSDMSSNNAEHKDEPKKHIGSSDMSSNNGHVNEPVVKKVLEGTFNDHKYNNDYTVTSFTFKIGDRQFDMANNKIAIDLGFLDDGLSQNNFYEDQKEVNDSGRNTEYKSSDIMTSYNQFYSLVFGARETELYENGYSIPNADFSIMGFLGQPTLMTQLPSKRSATYKGTSFTDSKDHGLQKGYFEYSVDFEFKTGHGYFTLGNQRTELVKANLMSQQNISDLNNNDDNRDFYVNDVQVMFGGAAINPNQPEGHYVVALYGPHAEEAAGAVKIGDGKWKYGLGGKRGEIK